MPRPVYEICDPVEAHEGPAEAASPRARASSVPAACEEVSPISCPRGGGRMRHPPGGTEHPPGGVTHPLGRIVHPPSRVEHPPRHPHGDMLGLASLFFFPSFFSLSLYFILFFGGHSSPETWPPRARVGLFHPDRSKLQKPGGPPHGRRRTCKGALPALSKDSPVSLPTGSVPLSVTTSLQLNHSQEDSSRCSDNSSYEEPLSPISASSSTSRRRQGDRDLELRDMELPDMHMRDLAGIGHRFLPSEPSKWNVEDVYEFIRSLPGCQEIAEEFRAQEIDGQALLLLKEDHLMSTMNIKLGPALKIYARISMLKDS
uniref:Polyhomeotic homolog 2 n=1 Tax=Dromaius novaehollandiae TaxID=8790 RepID=A0A8C4K8L5_DRONO